jgi:prepilin-type processing-associated H-X9-DG protein
VNVPLKTLLCPSTPEGDRIDVIPGTRRTARVSDYGPMNAVAQELIDRQLVPASAQSPGAMTVDERTPIAEITDGTSNTLLLTEDAGRPKHWLRGKLVGPPNSSPSCSTEKVLSGRVLGAAWASDKNAFPLHTFTADGSQCPGPCVMNCTNNNEAYSFHPGGVNMVFVDGSVKFVAETIQITTFAALITRSGSEILSAADY